MRIAEGNITEVVHSIWHVGGKSKYSWTKMIRLACDGLFAFSSLPLRLSFLLMFVTGAFGLSYSLYGLFVYL